MTKVFIEVDETILDNFVNTRLLEGMRSLEDSICYLEYLQHQEQFNKHQQEDLDNDRRYLEAHKVLQEYYGF